MSHRSLAREHLSLAGQALQHGSWAASLPHYVAAVRSDRTWVDPWLGLTEALSGLGLYTWAAEAAEQAALRAQEGSEPRLARVRQLLASGEVVRGLEEVLELRGRVPEASRLTLEAELQAAAGRPHAALDAWNRRLADDPASVEALRGRSQALFSLHRYAEAADTLQRLLEEAPADDDARAALRSCRSAISSFGPGPLPSNNPLSGRDPRPLSGRARDAQVAWERGCALEADGRWDEAVVQFGTALEALPHWTHCALRLARAALHIDDASKVLEQLRLLPQRSELISLAMGELMVHQHLPDQAAEVLGPLRDDRTVGVRAWSAWSRAMLEMARPEDALAGFRTALVQAPGTPELLVGRAMAIERTGSEQEALEAWQAAAARTPQDMGVQLHLRAMTAIALGQTLAPAEVAVGTAWRHQGLRRWEDALDAADRALQDRPTDPAPLLVRARALQRLGRHDEGARAWTDLLGQESIATEVQQGLSACCMRESLNSGAQPPKMPVEAPDMATDPEKKEAARRFVEQGRVFAQRRDYTAAIQAFQKALDLDPEYLEAALRLGMAYEDDRQYNLAVQCYDLCLAIDADNVQAATNMGEAYRKAQRYPKAIKAYDHALARNPEYVYALAGRAECLRMLGDHEGSLEWFDKAIQQNSRHAFAIRGKAAALNSLRRFSDALPLWKLALEVEPNSKFALDGKTYCELQLKKAQQKLGGDGLRTSNPGVSTSASATDGDEEESTTPTLDEQGRDLTAAARRGELGKVVGRKEEIRQVMKTLVRRQKANPLLLGDPGVGKTAVVEGVAALLARDDAPRRLRNLRLIELSMGSLVAGTKYRGTFEERLKTIVKEASTTPGIVLFIDEIHTLVGAGRTEGGSLDAANILKPALARGEITVIGATTVSEYRKHFESDPALERRFQPIQIEELNADATIHLLEKVQDKYAQHHEVRIQPEALKECVRLSVRYLFDRHLPDKALDVLDEACADVSLAGDTWVTPDIVAKVISERTGVPVQKLTREEKQQLSSLRETLEERVIGQPDAVRRVASAVKVSRSGLRDPRKPRGVFLFVGPSGVGKTELARTLSEVLFPDAQNLVKVDMSEYSEKFTATRLLGAPPGYAGHGEEGQLTGPLRRRPYSVVLLDEFEKAHPDVQALFLSLFEEGRVTDAEGRTVQAQESYFILTSNAGVGMQKKRSMGFGGPADPSKEAEEAIERIRPLFRPELLNRMDDIVWFRNLDEANLERIVEIHLGKLAQRAAERNVCLTWDEAVIAHCAEYKPDAAFGARPALRAVSALVAEPLGTLMLGTDGDGDPDEEQCWHANVRDGEIHFERVQVAAAVE